tara:strand:+ start:776 stop:1405 length:630 start_codon:yes stop_codon:yes gene_type:complete
MMTYFYGSVILSNCLLLAAFIYGSSNKQLFGNKSIKWFITYLGFILSIEIITLFLIYILNSDYSSITYPCYITGEFFILSNMFIFSLGLSSKWRLLAGILSFVLFIEAITLWYYQTSFTPGYGKIFSHISIICMAGYLLIKNLKELETHNPFTIIYAALFLYYAVSLFLFLLMNQLTEANIILWIMNNVLSSILYGTSIYTFYQLKKSI